MARDVVHTVAVQRGSLAREMFAAYARVATVEHQLEQMLDSLYGRDGWSDWEAGDGTLEVYSVLASDAAVFALHRAGYAAVRQHGHPRERFTTCACVTRRDHL